MAHSDWLIITHYSLLLYGWFRHRDKQDQPNPALCLATRAAGWRYLAHPLSCLWTFTSSRFINTQKRTWPIFIHLDLSLRQYSICYTHGPVPGPSKKKDKKHNKTFYLLHAFGLAGKSSTPCLAVLT